MDAHRFLKGWIEIVDEDGQARNMVHVDVSNYDVLHPRALVGRERDCNAAGIKRDAIVDEIAGEALVQSRFAIAVEGAW